MSYNPYYQLRRSTKDLHKYLFPGAGRRLAREFERNLGFHGKLPKHYLDYYYQWRKRPMAWIHTKPRHEKYERNEKGEIVPVQHPNIAPIYPLEFHYGLWGGEGVVKGFIEPPPSKHKPNYAIPKHHYWYPKLHESVVYSEVLDKHIEMLATKRGEWLIDQHKGFDSYLLETPVNEVYAQMLLLLKREILLALSRKTLWPQDSVRRDELLDKYKDYIWPEEVADWHGLPFVEALNKYYAETRIQEEKAAVPRKHQYRKELYSQLKEGYFTDVDVAMLENEYQTQDSSIKGWLKGFTNKIMK